MTAPAKGHASRRLAKRLAPPLLWDLGRSVLRRFRRTGGTTAAPREWQYVPEGWEYRQVHEEVRGWNVQEILSVYQEKWPRFLELIDSTGPLGFSHESRLDTDGDIRAHNAAMAYGWVLGLAAAGRETLSILDWGGGIGHYYALARALFPDLELDYHCRDVPLLAEHGASLFPELHFHSDDACLDHSYDLVMASAAMHYVENWCALLRRLAGATRGYLYIANLPTVTRVTSYVYVQRPYQYGYGTEYLGWAVNRRAFLECAQSTGLELRRELESGYSPPVSDAPERPQYQGFLFHRAASDGGGQP